MKKLFLLSIIALFLAGCTAPNIEPPSLRISEPVAIGIAIDYIEKESASIQNNIGTETVEKYSAEFMGWPHDKKNWLIMFETTDGQKVGKHVIVIKVNKTSGNVESMVFR